MADGSIQHMIGEPRLGDSWMSRHEPGLISKWASMATTTPAPPYYPPRNCVHRHPAPPRPFNVPVKPNAHIRQCQHQHPQAELETAAHGYSLFHDPEQLYLEFQHGVWRKGRSPLIAIAKMWANEQSTNAAKLHPYRSAFKSRNDLALPDLKRCCSTTKLVPVVQPATPFDGNGRARLDRGAIPNQNFAHFQAAWKPSGHIPILAGLAWFNENWDFGPTGVSSTRNASC